MATKTAVIKSSRGRHFGFELLVKVTTGEHDTAAAAAANQADIRSQADDFPLETSTRMFFSQSDDIAQLNLDVHRVRLYHASSWQI
jgi:hypothetical protein